MEHQNMLNLLNEANDSKFVTRKWNIVGDNSKSNYASANETTYNKEIKKSNLCGYNDAYILVAALQTQVTFENCAKFTKCIPKN